MIENAIKIIKDIKEKQAEFVTCYLADSWTIQKIKKSKKWPREKEKPSSELDGSGDSA
ncbi:MAG: hypothetical protein MUC43_14535 [Pirellula sp.]|nr:hypothetical protein [Pirellula sp.]